MKKWWLMAAVWLLLPSLVHAQMVPIPEQRSAALEGSHVFSGVNLYSVTVQWHTQAARWLMVFDSATVPGDGAVTPIFCAPVSTATGLGDGFQSFDWPLHPIHAVTGITMAVSTNATGCFAKTVDGANDAFFAQITN